MIDGLCDFPPGVCFGYFDESFDECKSCKLGRACKMSLSLDNLAEIRGMKKDSARKVLEASRKVESSMEAANGSQGLLSSTVS